MSHNPVADALEFVASLVHQGKSVEEALLQAAQVVHEEEPKIAEAEKLADAVAPAEAAALEPLVADVEHVADAIANPGNVHYPWLVGPQPPTEEGAGAQPATIETPETHQEVPASVDDPAPDLSQNAPDYPGRGLVGDYGHSCGEEAARIIVKSTRGVSVPREYIVACIHGSETAPASTTPEQIAGYLAGEDVNLPAVVDRQPWPHQVATLETQLAQDHLVAVLGDWYGRGLAHWIVAKGYDAHELIYDDPWPAAGDQGERRMAWTDVGPITQAEGGAMVLVKEPARYR